MKNLVKFMIVVLAILILWFASMIVFTFEETDKYSKTYSIEQQCEMVTHQISYQREWDYNVLKKLQTSNFYDLGFERERLIKEQVNIVYDCEIRDKNTDIDLNIIDFLLNNNEDKTIYSRLLFLKLANSYNHQFIKLNDEYELKKSEIDRKAEIKKSLEIEVNH